MAQNPYAPSAGGTNRTLNITAATVVKAAPGTLYTISVVVAGSAAGAVYDNTLTTGNTAANQVGVIPATAGFIQARFACLSGIVVAPGTGQTISVSFQ